MITKEELQTKKTQVLTSKAEYMKQIVACDGALKIIEDLETLYEKS